MPMSLAGIFGLLVETAKSFAMAGPKLNREQREQIREVVGELLDTLTDSLDLTIIYLNHAKHARPDELVAHLADARWKLNQSFREFKICGGLYNLRDRFRALVSLPKLAVNAQRVDEIVHLVNDLADGERSVLDFLEGRTRWMNSKADALAKLKPGSVGWNKARGELLKELNAEVDAIEEMRDGLKRDVRHLIDRM